jgi:hypothetical protein
VISDDLLEGAAQDLLPWISRDQLTNDVVDGKNMVYVLSNVYDPVISE